MPDTSRSDLSEALASRYQLHRELGRGGMATVYLAEDLRHGRFVALKVVRPELLGPTGSDRFLREIQIVARLQHPHILPLFDSGEAAGLPYFVMPYIEGESLRERIDRAGALPVDLVLHLTRQIATALTYAHERGIVHRDIKPQNILLGHEDAFIADFGIAKALSGTDPGGTQVGIVVGTPEYMSPEQASGESDVDGRSDQYSLGCLVYEMLSGAPPFRGPSARAVLALHVTAAVPSLSARVSRVEATVRRALSKAPDDRFPTVRAFADALELSAAQRGEPYEESAPVREPNLGPLIVKTCNRWKQMNAFDAFFRESRRQFGRRPQAYFLPGAEGQGHASLVERLVGTRIERFAGELGGHDRGTVARFTVPWPNQDALETLQRDLTIALFREVDPNYLDTDLSASALAGRPAMSRAAIVVLQHELHATDWDRTTGDLLGWYLQEYWGALAQAVPPQQFLLFFKVVYQESRWPVLFHRLRVAARTTTQQRRELELVLAKVTRCACLVFSELEPITASDVYDWLERHGIYESERQRREAAQQLFRDSPAKPMVEIEAALADIQATLVRTSLLGRPLIT